VSLERHLEALIDGDWQYALASRTRASLEKCLEFMIVQT